MSQDMSDTESIFMDQLNIAPLHEPQQPIKIRKKPGRKPNPASPALRKAQNRAAQRAFRERKERHMRDLEIAIKQIREQRDTLHTENEQLKANQEIMRSENWYLKGIVLTLQLVCFQHNLVIPQHGPYINEQALSVLAQSIPEPISSYISVNASNKLPIPSKLFGHRHTMKQRDRYLSSGSIVVSKDGVCTVPDVSSLQRQQGLSTPAPIDVSTSTETSSTLEGLFSPDVPTNEDLVHPFDGREASIPPLSPGSICSESEPQESPTLNALHENRSSRPKPVMLSEEPLTSNLAAVQALRLRLRLQSSYVRMDETPYTIQPTILQLTIPHDPRIDLIPTSHMRDRMILFRDQFDLDDCFRCLLEHSVFHGGDPAIAGNWQLPSEFFEKYWFLTIDYNLRRTTNKWRRLQGLDDLDFSQRQAELEKAEQHQQQPDLENAPSQKLDFTDLSAILGIDFWKIAQQKCTPSNKPADKNDESSYASSLSSDHSSTHSDGSALNVSPITAEEDSGDSFEPVRLTNGYSYPQKISKKPYHHKSPMQRHHPYQKPTKSKSSISFLQNLDSTCDPWDTLLVDPLSTTSNDDYDMLGLKF